MAVFISSRSQIVLYVDKHGSGKKRRRKAWTMQKNEKVENEILDNKRRTCTNMRKHERDTGGTPAEQRAQEQEQQQQDTDSEHTPTQKHISHPHNFTHTTPHAQHEDKTQNTEHDFAAYRQHVPTLRYEYDMRRHLTGMAPGRGSTTTQHNHQTHQRQYYPADSCLPPGQHTAQHKRRRHSDHIILAFLTTVFTQAFLPRRRLLHRLVSFFTGHHDEGDVALPASKQNQC